MVDLLAIVGTTASGKSQLAMRIAQEFSGEIIAADSRTVYRDLNIGTAKPTVDDQKLVRHHLLDVVRPDQEFNVANYKHLAQSAINDVRKRGKLPILAGGSGLYVNSVLYNYSFSGVIRDKQLRSSLGKLSVGELQDRIKSLGLSLPTNPHNKRYLIRRIETAGNQPTTSKLPINSLIIGLAPSRSVLEERVRSRLQSMLQTGLLDEARHVLKNYPNDIEPLKSNIYRSLVPYFEGCKTLDEASEDFVRLDLKLAKKQLTWFKRNKDIVWFTNSLDEAYEYAASRLRD